jgi:hypothetical protein
LQARNATNKPTDRIPSITARAPKKDDYDAIKPEQHGCDNREDQVDLGDTELRADPVDQVIVPDSLSSIANRQRLDARHSAQRFEKMRILTSGVDHRLLIRSAVLRRLRIFGQQDKLRADRSKGRETWA